MTGTLTSLGTCEATAGEGQPARNAAVHHGDIRAPAAPTVPHTAIALKHSFK